MGFNVGGAEIFSNFMLDLSLSQQVKFSSRKNTKVSISYFQVHLGILLIWTFRSVVGEGSDGITGGTSARQSKLCRCSFYHFGRYMFYILWFQA